MEKPRIFLFRPSSVLGLMAWKCEGLGTYNTGKTPREAWIRWARFYELKHKEKPPFEYEDVIDSATKAT